MADSSQVKTKGKNIALYRTYTDNASLSATEYLAASQFNVGINNGTQNIADTNLDYPIPISDGTTNDDGSNNMTGSSGGDNSTDNTSTFKYGAGQTDNTGQNLIANNTSATKKWEIASLTVDADAAKYTSLWFYILDSTALAKLLTSGTAVEIRIGVDTTANYYSYTRTSAQLSVGWNWISTGDILSTWTTVGTPGTLNNFAIIITTNNATDEFVAGDIVYDLLRQWEESDFFKDFELDPTLDFTNNKATTRCLLSSTNANGFDVNSLGLHNKDTSRLMASGDTFTAESKEPTDEFALVAVDKFKN